MKKGGEKRQPVDELRPNYEFDYSKAIRGKYRHRLLTEGNNVVVSDPNVGEAVKDSTPIDEQRR